MSVVELVEATSSIDSFRSLREAFSGSSVTVTGGASFIGSHLVDVLLDLGAHVRVIDDFSSGKLSNLTPNPNLTVVEGDLRDIQVARSEILPSDVVFHLAAIHGGRGFIETQQSAMTANLAIDNNVYRSALDSGVGMIVNASSACAYPVDLQAHADVQLLMAEDQAGMGTPEKSFPDGAYGWIKLFGEYQLATMIQGTGARGRSARVFTAYGERENESHAAVALIAKALLRMDPYPIWGNGQQTRNFTYVADTVHGLLLLGSDTEQTEFDVYNVGTSEHVRVIEFIRAIFERLNWQPSSIDFQLDRPVGVASRAADNRKIRERFGWCPSVTVSEGVDRTLSWYREQEERPTTVAELESLLLAR